MNEDKPISLNETNYKLLIIEDDKFLRDLLSQKLSRDGFKVTAVVGGEDGLKSAVENKPDLILLDLVLPGIDGFEILDRVKKDPKLSSIPVIILSNLGQKEDIDRALGAGAANFMIKANFTPSEIAEKIKTILKKSYI